MKHLSFLTLLALALAGFASAQSVTVSRDTVYESLVFEPYDDGFDDPRYMISISNTSSDTLFTDTVMVDLLSSPTPDPILFLFNVKSGGGGNVGIFVSEDYQNEQVPDFYFAPGVEDTLYGFCISVLADEIGCSSPGNPDSTSESIWAVVKVRWYMTNGDSLSFFMKGDYYRGSVPIGKSLKPQPVLQGIEGTPYLINGKSVERHSKGKTPVPIIRRTRDD